MHTWKLTLIVLLVLSSNLYAQKRTVEIKEKLEDKAEIPKVKEEALHLVKEKVKLDTQLVKNQKDYFNQKVKKKYSLLKDVYDAERDTLRKWRLPPLFRFNTGEATLLQQIAQREGNFPVDNPANFTRLTLNTSAQVLGVPFLVQALHSTEQQHLPSQPMNRFSVSLDVATWKQQVDKRIDDRLATLESTLQVEELKKLEQLYDLYEEGDIPFLDSKALAQELKNLEAYQQIDSLKQVAKALPQDIQERAEEEAENLKEKGETEIKQRQEAYEKQAQEKLDKKTEKKSQKINKYLKKKDLTLQKLRRLQHLYDSVQRVAPEAIADYETYMILKALKEGNREEAMQRAKKYNIISLPERLAASLHTLTVGTVYPTHGEYVINGQPLEGAEVALQMGNLYLGYAGTRNLRAVPEQATFERKMNIISAGVGKKEEDHLIFSYMSASDDPNSFQGDRVVRSIGDTTFYNRPRKNYVLDAHFSFSPTSFLSVEGEAAYSLTAMDLYSQSISFGDLFNSMSANTTDTALVQAGKAYSLTGHAEVRAGTRLSLKLYEVDATFYSLGVPFLMNGVRGYEASLEQSFWQGQLVVRPFFGEARGNTEETSNSTMVTYGAQASITPQGLPYGAVDYRMTQMTNGFLNTTELWNIQAGYDYRLEGINFNSSLVASLQESKNEGTIGETVIPPENIATKAHVYTLNQTATFNFPLMANLNVSYRDLVGGIEAGQWIAVGTELSYSYKGIWENSVGFSLGRNQDGTNKQSALLRSSVKFLKKMHFTATVENTQFEAQETIQNYQEFRSGFMLGYTF